MNTDIESKMRDTTQASKIRKIKAVVILFYLALIAGLALYDEKPNPEMLKALSSPQPEVLEPGNGWVAAIGFAAPKGVSPYTWGEGEIRKLENMALAGKSFKELLTAKINDDKPELPFKGSIPGGIFIGYKNDGNKMILHAATHANDIAALVGENKVLLQRYDLLRMYPYYTESLDVGYSAIPDLPIVEIGHAHRLKILQQAILASHGDIDGPLEDLKKDIDFWRMVARDSNLMISKLISIEHLQIDLLYASELASYRHLNAKEMKLVRSILRPMGNGETTTSRQLLGEFRCEQKGLEMDMSRSKKLLGIIGSPFFKHYATANRAYVALLENIHLDGLPPEKFAIEFEKLEKTAAIRNRIGLPFLYNPDGEEFAVIMGSVAYYGYMMNVHNLEGFRRLALLKVLIHQEDIPPDRIQQFLDSHKSDLGDIYTDVPMKWDPKKGSIFFSDPGGGGLVGSGRIEIFL